MGGKRLISEHCTFKHNKNFFQKIIECFQIIFKNIYKFKKFSLLNINELKRATLKLRKKTTAIIML